jgi:hypothetical protein
VNTLKRIDWMIAFTVSSIPTLTHTQTSAMASGRRRKGEQREESKGRGCQVAVSDHLPESRRHPRPNRPGSGIEPPTMRKAWTHNDGTRANSSGRRDRRGLTYQSAISAYAARLNVNRIPNNTIGSIILSASRSR